MRTPPRAHQPRAARRPTHRATPPRRTIQIKENEFAPITFKVKKGIKFDKIFNAFYTKKGAAPGTYAFTYDGTAVEKDDSPASIGMQEGDQIDALVKQTGGAAACGVLGIGHGAA